MAKSTGKDKPGKAGQAASQLLEAQLAEYLANATAAKTAVDTERTKLPGEVVDRLNAVMQLTKPSYRDAVMIQLAFGLVSSTDHTMRQKGGRSVAARLGSFLARQHIRAVADAFQNIGKNSRELCRGNQLEFDQLLHWANGATREQRQAAFRFVLASVSLTARPVLPMPELDHSRLIFTRVVRLLDDLVGTPSGGVYQQFTVAACLDALLDEFGQTGRGMLRVETKDINVSDASAATIGDIQIKRGNKTEEAFEVTANPWASKIEPAIRLLRNADLPRVHVIADVGKIAAADVAELESGNIDLSLIDVGAFIHTMMAIMRKPARRRALMRLYDLLDRVHGNIDRTNAYVRLLEAHRLTLDARSSEASSPPPSTSAK